MPLPSRSSLRSSVGPSLLSGGIAVAIATVALSAFADATPASLPVKAASPAAAAKTPTPAPPVMDIQLRGPLALIEVDRPLRWGREYGARAVDEVVLDFALPAGARLARAELHGANAGAPPVRLRPAVAATARAAYEGALRERQWRRQKVAPQIDEGADLRLAVAGEGLSGTAAPEALRVRARFVAPLVCRAGDLVLAFPAALDATTFDIAVHVHPEGQAVAIDRIEIADLKVSHPRAAVHAQVKSGNPWELVIRPARGANRLGNLLIARAGNAIAANLCRAPVARATSSATAAMPLPASGPGRVLFLIDRSRSMGPQGASSAGALAKALVLALPPGARFAAVLFDREAAPLFPVFRAPTLEATGALESAIEAGSLRNGTNLIAALRRAEQLLAGDLTEPGAARDARPPLVVVITDGAVPDDQTRAAVEQASRGPGLGRARFAVLMLRKTDDEPPTPAALRTLAVLPARRGGLFRQIDPIGAAGQAADLIAALAAGGDLVDLQAVSGFGVGHFDQKAVAPGHGTTWLGNVSRGTVGRTDPAPPLWGLRGSLGGQVVRWELASDEATEVDAAWAPAVEALATSPARLPAWEALPDTGARLALLTPPPPEEPTALTGKGQLDRDVVHRALAYAYLPRARACYLTRAVKTAADFQLRGRLRLELHLERGEMTDAVVARSTLGRAEIERCLREAAFLVDVPRPSLADVPAIAALNLVFRPRTDPAAQDAAPTSDADRGLAQSIDHLLGPRGPAADPLELLIEDDARPPQPKAR
jgi:hypothetical protein